MNHISFTVNYFKLIELGNLLYTCDFFDYLISIIFIRYSVVIIILTK